MHTLMTKLTYTFFLTDNKTDQDNWIASAIFTSLLLFLLSSFKFLTKRFVLTNIDIDND